MTDPADLAETEALLRDSVARFAQGTDHLARMRRLRHAEPAFDPLVWRDMAALGWLGIAVPEDRGGLGLGLGPLALVARHLSRVLLPEPLTAVAGVAATVIAQGTNAALCDDLLRRMVDGEALPVLAWQEADRFDRDAPFATRATRRDGGWTLGGAKRHVMPGIGFDSLIVAATGDAGPGLFLVSRAAAGLDVTPRRLADGAWSADVGLRDVAVADDAVLAAGDDARRALGAGLDAATLLHAAELLGVAEAAMALLLDHIGTRRQFDRPVGSFQALQHRAVDVRLQIALAEAALRAAVGDQGSAAASRAKARCAEAARLATAEAVQMHGAMGYTDECDVGLFLKRALVLEAGHGNRTDHRRRAVALMGADPAGQEAGLAARPAPFDPATDWEALPDDVFRATVRAYFERNYPSHLRNPSRRMHWREMRDWYLEMARIGWLAVGWPKAHGGAGLSVAKQLVFMEEQERWGVARAPDMGVTLVGPTLIRFGTQAQRDRFLPPILRGEHVWCQGYSEPEAGSDLASLRTEAVADGDDFVVTGQKIWTTLAQDATHMFALVRTDRAAKAKQAGISFVLIDLSVPGVTVRPIKVLSGHEEFCEVFFDRVRTPRANLVGPLNGGWTVAKALLGFERIFLGSPKQAQFALTQLHRLAQANGMLDDPPFFDRFARLRLDVADLSSLYAAHCEVVRRGDELGPDVSMLKVWASETYQRIAELAVEAAGARGGMTGPDAGNGVPVDPLAIFYNSRPATIYGGSNEIQRNIIAKAVLGLKA